jgi:arabinofuranosyltransferase
VLFRTAWVCDDAYITFRTIDNFVHGYGLRWNVDERVQAFTHPLWLLLLTPIVAVTEEPWLTSMLVSLALSMAGACIIAFRIATTPWTAAAVVLALLFSKSFVDFSTSGLENALSHLLVVSIVAAGNLQLFGLGVGLLAVNRLDLLPLIVPMFVATVARAPRLDGLKATAAAVVPLLAWEAFSVSYYGYPFPNTAYAKLSTGIAPGMLMRQGWLYFTVSFLRDPITLTLIAFVPIAALSRRRLWPAAIGLSLYLLYVARIGGDFMAGRFLSAPFVLAVTVLSAEIRLTTARAAGCAIAAITVLGLLPSRPTVLSDGYYSASEISPTGIADERGVYYAVTGLLRKRHEWQPPRVPLQERYAAASARGRHAIVADFIGLQGYLAGPRLHIIDRLALPDPLLSRLPCDSGWRIGHFARTLPDGYFDSVNTGTNAITDPNLAQYYDRILLITRGDIWSRSRWSAIVRMNVGAYDAWLRAYVAGRRSTSPSARSDLTKIHPAVAPSGSALTARRTLPGWMKPKNSSETVTAVGIAATAMANRVLRGPSPRDTNHAATAPSAPEKYSPAQRPQTGS